MAGSKRRTLKNMKRRKEGRKEGKKEKFTRSKNKLASGFINDANKKNSDRLIINSNGNTKYFKKDSIKKPKSSLVVYHREVLYMSPDLANKYNEMKKNDKTKKKCKKTKNIKKLEYFTYF